MASFYEWISATLRLEPQPFSKTLNHLALLETHNID